MATIFLALAAGWIASTGKLHGQTNVSPTDNIRPVETAAGSPASDTNPVVQSDTAVDSSATTAIGVTPAGVQRHVAGKWATLAVNGTNPTADDTEETIVVMLGDDAKLQYARKLWIPAGARRQAWLPVRLPDELEPDQLQIDCKVIHLQESEQGESFQSNRVGSPTTTRSLLLSPEADERAALILEPLDQMNADAAFTQSLTDMIYAGYDSSVSTLQDLGMTQLSSVFLPPTANPLDSLDEMVIASDRLLSDTVGVTRLQSWLQAGGRVWIMADQVQPESVRALMGDAMGYSVVDRVQLNEFEIEQLDPYFLKTVMQENWSSETPVEMVRVVTDAQEIHSRIDGWPAAFWVPVGQGELLVTTLGAQGWLQNGAPTNTFRTLSSRFFVKRFEPPSHQELLASQLNREIGYRIPGRTLIATLLGLHLLVILVVGGWLAHRKALHYLGMVLPASALVAVAALLWIGKQHTSAVPSTIATGQIARASSDNSNLQVETVAAIYSQDAKPLPIRSPAESITMPVGEADPGELRRILWQDTGESQWQFLQQPPGKVQHVRTLSNLERPTPWEVRGRFTPLGFEGELKGLDAADSQDPVVISAALPNMSVTLDKQSGRLRSGTDQVLLPDQFFNEALLSDTQRERQTLIRELMKSDTSLKTREPSLLFWTQPVQEAVSFSDDFVRRGWTLGLCPIQLEPLEPGSRFVVPAGFVRLESHVGTRGPSTVFNAETGRWLDSMDKPSESQLLCRLPSAVLPCELQRCDVEMRVTAPGRTVEIKGMIDGEFQTVHRVDSPSGRVSFAIEDPRVLSLTPEGGFLISIAVSETEQERERQKQPARDLDAPDGEAVLDAPDGEAVLDSPDGEAVSAAYDDTNSITWAISYVHLNVEGTTK